MGSLHINNLAPGCLKILRFFLCVPVCIRLLQTKFHCLKTQTFCLRAYKKDRSLLCAGTVVPPFQGHGLSCLRQLSLPSLATTCPCLNTCPSLSRPLPVLVWTLVPAFQCHGRSWPSPDTCLPLPRPGPVLA